MIFMKNRVQMCLESLLKRDDLYYRGYDSRYGVFESRENHSFTWITDDAEYALEYAKNKLFGKIAIIELTSNKIGGVFSLDEYTDYYAPTESEMQSLYGNGEWGYGFYCNDDISYCVCVNKCFLKIVCVVDSNTFLTCLKDLGYE